MVVFDEILSELLMQNNCVVIPSLGGFVANTVSAKVDVEKGVITPPKKAISFNKSLTNNDGLLVNALAEKRRVSYDNANNSVSTDVAKIKSQLNAGERVHFQNVGFLYLNNAGKMAFEQDRFFNLLLESYGMGSVHFVPVEVESPVVESKPEQKEGVEKPKMNVVLGGSRTVVETSQDEHIVKSKKTVSSPKSSQKKTSTLRKIVRYAAAAALIPVAFYSFWIPMKTDVLQSGVVYSEDFNPFSDHEEAKYVEGIAKERIEADKVVLKNELRNITSHLTPNVGDVFSFPITEDEYVSVRYNKTVNDGNANTDRTSGDYHLIVGCFREESNAQNMINKLDELGWQGIVIDKHEGLHRVSAAASDNRNDIMKKRSEIENKGLSSWVLKK